MQLREVILVQTFANGHEAGDVSLVLLQARELLLREQRMQSPHDVLDVLDHEISYQTRTQGVRTAVLDTRPTNLPFSREQALELRDARKKRSQAVGDDGRRTNLQSRDVNRQEQEHPPKEHQRDPTERSFQEEQLETKKNILVVLSTLLIQN